MSENLLTSSSSSVSKVLDRMACEAADCALPDTNTNFSFVSLSMNG